MNDPVDGVLAQREALDRGFSSSLLVSGVAHATLLGGAFLAAFLAPKQPLIHIASGFVVQLPRGGGGNPNPAPPASLPPKAEPKEAEAAPEPEPPKIIKPPSEEPRKGLPELESKKTAKKPEPTRAAPRTASATPASPVRQGTARTAGPGGTGTSNQPLGLEMLPVGPGVPGGADGGDYYMAGVQRKIWTIWMQQVKNDFSQPVSVTFTIMADGSVPFGTVQITTSSGVTLLDNAAKRAVLTAAPFSPLPRDYGTSQITVQANFKPTP